MRTSNYFIILALIGFILLGAFHEQVHVQIYSSYGIDSRVEYFKGFPSFQTIADDTSGRCSEECNLAHNINEAISYPLGIVYILITFGFNFLMREEEERNIYK